jgi:hypothetical protein
MRRGLVCASSCDCGCVVLAAAGEGTDDGVVIPLPMAARRKPAWLCADNITAFLVRCLIPCLALRFSDCVELLAANGCARRHDYVAVADTASTLAPPRCNCRMAHHAVGSQLSEWLSSPLQLSLAGRWHWQYRMVPTKLAT